MDWWDRSRIRRYLVNMGYNEEDTGRLGKIGKTLKHFIEPEICVSKKFSCGQYALKCNFILFIYHSISYDSTYHGKKIDPMLMVVYIIAFC